MDEKIDIRMMTTRAIRNKRKKPVLLAAQAVSNGEADAVLSAGKIHALLWQQDSIVGRIKNIDTPGLSSTLPTVDGKGFDMLETLINAEKIQPSTSINMRF